MSEPSRDFYSLQHVEGVLQVWCRTHDNAYLLANIPTEQWDKDIRPGRPWQMKGIGHQAAWYILRMHFNGRRGIEAAETLASVFQNEFFQGFLMQEVGASPRIAFNVVTTWLLDYFLDELIAGHAQQPAYRQAPSAN